MKTHEEHGSMPGTFYGVRTSSTAASGARSTPDRTDIPILGNFLDAKDATSRPRPSTGRARGRP